MEPMPTIPPQPNKQLGPAAAPEAANSAELRAETGSAPSGEALSDGAFTDNLGPAPSGGVTPETALVPRATLETDTSETGGPSGRGPGGRSARQAARVRGAAGLFALVLLAATLGSGGTYLALSASGALNRVALTSVTAAAIGQSTSLQAPGTSTPDVPNAAGSDSSSAVIAAAARVSPAVVTIISSSNASDVYAHNPFGLGGGAIQTGIGSGVIFDPNGWILTNHHVVADATSLSVQLSNGKSYPARVYGIDTLTDLAIVKIDATGLPTVQFGDSSSLKVGQLAIAIGDPLGQYQGTVTTGVISGVNRSIDVSNESLNDLIQTDAAINPGNSGGPLVDASGQVIGINTAEASSAQGIGFAIPINLARPLTQQALAGQPLSRPWLGIRYETLDAGLAATNHLSVNSGAWITSGQSGQVAVEANSPAAKAGLQENDVIVAVDGTNVDDGHPLDELLALHAPGSSVNLTVVRGSSTLQVQVTLATRPTTAQ